MSTSVTDSLTRRGFLGGAAGSAVLLGLAGCAGGSPESGVSGATAATRRIATAKGSIDVPTDPKRVVCLDPGFSWQTLVSVGLTPVGVPTVIDSLVRADNLSRIDGVTTVAAATGLPDLEKIAALRPDLILATTGAALDKTYPTLSRIAPTAVYSFDLPSDWVSLAQSFAGVVNRASRLAAVTAEYHSRIATLKQRFAKTIAGQRWALVTKSERQVFTWGTSSSAGPVLTECGARFSAGAPARSTPFTQLSTERLGTLSDATAIFYGATSDGKPYADTGGLLHDPLFTRLPAARAGRVYPLPSWFAYCYEDALTQIDGITAACAKIET